jgi:hypothetical protein
MKIRDHPSIVIWPPEWGTSFGNGSPPFDTMEKLMLREVELFFPQLNDYHGYIRIAAEYGRKTGKTYTDIKTGVIYTSIITIIRDPELVDRLYQKLKSSIGQTIGEIGNSEI